MISLLFSSLLALSFAIIPTKVNKMSFKVESLGEKAYDLGEGPHWEPKSQSLYFVDAFVGKIIRLNDGMSGQTNEYNLKDLVTIVIPFESNPNIVLLSLRNKIIKFNTNTSTHEVIAEIGAEFEGKERFNDGKLDSMGRLWIGSVFDSPNGAVPQKGSLYKLEKNKFVKMSEKFTLSNGITWNLNNTKMYFNDSEDQKIYVFDFDLENGLISNKTIFIDLKTSPDFKANEYPDGMTTDKTDKLWVSLYGGGRVVQINQTNGKVEKWIDIPALLTTSLAFGGNDLNQLYITSGNNGLSDQQKAEYPNAGKLFRVTSSDPNFGAARPQPYFDSNK